MIPIRTRDVMHRAVVNGVMRTASPDTYTHTGHGSSVSSALAVSSRARACGTSPSNQVHMFGMRYSIDVAFRRRGPRDVRGARLAAQSDLPADEAGDQRARVAGRHG